MATAHAGLVGLLLAAGRGRRFDPSGRSNKLLMPGTQGPHAGKPLAVAAALGLRAAVPRVIAVVRASEDPATRELAARLTEAGCELVVNARAESGMGTSLACGVRASADATGWIIALADMPAIRPETIALVADALTRGALTAAPHFNAQRGHPVGFGAALRDALLALEGDAGARDLLRAHPPQRLAVDDPGILYDVDCPDVGSEGVPS